MWWIGRRGIRVMVNMRLVVFKIDKKNLFRYSNLPSDNHYTLDSNRLNHIKQKQISHGRLVLPNCKFLCPFYLNLELPQDMSVLVFRTFS